MTEELTEDQFKVIKYLVHSKVAFVRIAVPKSTDPDNEDTRQVQKNYDIYTGLAKTGLMQNAEEIYPKLKEAADFARITGEPEVQVYLLTESALKLFAEKDDALEGIVN